MRDSDVCTDIFIINNIVAAVDKAGYIAYGHICGDDNDRAFKNNTAHSITGVGAVIFPNGRISTHY